MYYYIHTTECLIESEKKLCWTGGLLKLVQLSNKTFFKFIAGFAKCSMTSCHRTFGNNVNRFFLEPDFCDTIMLCGVLHLVYGIAKAIGPKAVRIYKCQKKLNWNSSLF